MFDRVIAVPSSQRWKTLLLIGTVAGHAAVLVALVLVAFWKIERLPVSDDREILLSVATEAPPPGGAAPGTKLKVAKPTVAPKVKPLVPVQPTQLVTEPVPTPGGGDVGGGPTGGGGTNPDGDPDSTEVGTGTCALPPCGEPVPTPRPDPTPVVPTKPVVVAPNVAAGLRLSGTEKIYPPDRVRVAMVHAGQDQLQGTLKLCVDRAGAIESVKVLRSTGHGDYDAALVTEMRRWRYRPYQVDGVATAMCTVEVVIYRMRP